MIRFTLNGQPAELSEPMPLSTALQQLNYQNGLFAIALNRTFIAKERYTECIVNDGDELEIVSPIQGG